MEQRKITPVHYEVLIKVFELDGFIISRKKGHNNDKNGGKKTSCYKNKSKTYSYYTYSHQYDNGWHDKRTLFCVVSKNKIEFPLSGLPDQVGQ